MSFDSGADVAYCRSNPSSTPRSTKGKNAARQNALLGLGLGEGEVLVLPVLAALEDELVHEGRADGAGHGAEPEEPVVRPDAGHGGGAERAGCGNAGGWGRAWVSV